MNRYGIDIWGRGKFDIVDGKVVVNYKSKPAVIDIVSRVREQGLSGPLLIRFPHLIEAQISLIYDTFTKIQKDFKYRGSFNAVFPLKVNQYPGFVKNLTQKGKKYNYGLEAGSKAELILAMSYNNDKAPITVNGFKDNEMIVLGFLAAKMGQNITLTIEGINELENIVENIKNFDGVIPNIGLRIRLHSSGIGIWAKSGGINSKFGLTSLELITAIDILKKHDILDHFTMIHFHIGSQIEDIAPLKKALREAGNIFAELKKMGANNLKAINLGGGLAVEYSQNENSYHRNYSLEEYANDVIYLLQDISRRKGVEEPDIFIESGRYVAASHAVLVAPVLELFSKDYSEKALRLDKNNPPLVQELYELYKDINKKNALEFLHDSLDHMESLLTLFDLGYIDIEDRSNTEILVNLIIKKALYLLKDKNYNELLSIQDRVQERYLLNFSLFQSLPDNWGLGQNFPVMPLDKLDEKNQRSASLWDITCDSDGEISFDINNPLFLHDVNLDEEDYFLGFFLVGAYQETMGMEHNLFAHPTELSVEIDENGYKIENIVKSKNIMEILKNIEYNEREIRDLLYEKIDKSNLIPKNKKTKVCEMIDIFLNDNSYLKTDIIQPNFFD
ncbi:MAG: biosynthetic arginine decarboxylase [Epsilonproteobacteria bacterium]|nr:biosynthetic arginine decarboxylase [Campylobacterota bacterium]